MNLQKIMELHWYETIEKFIIHTYVGLGLKRAPAVPNN